MKIDVGQNYSIQDLAPIVYDKETMELSDGIRHNVRKGRLFLEEKIARDNRPYYGINTGFGELCHVRVGHDELETLQLNLIRSHACGVGPAVQDDVVRWMLVLKILSLSKGLSGVREEVLDGLLHLLNDDLIPEVPETGSLGASGDLAPLAHLCLPLIGEGVVHHSGERLEVTDHRSRLKLEPITLKEKEGLALLNGTQYMAAMTAHLLHQGSRVVDVMLHIAACSSEAFQAHTEFLDPRIHEARGQLGQIEAAKRLRERRPLDPQRDAELPHVQDPYSFRCMPQVFGATLDSMHHVNQVLEREINGVTDNPNVFPDSDAILIGGNFHGQPLAFGLDQLKVAFSELANISERRTFLLLSGKRDLPIFLTENAGLESGLMIAQYTAAALVNRCKNLCLPASMDSIVSSNGQEDHVSMGANAGVETLQILEFVEDVLAIEMLCASQALHLREKTLSSKSKAVQGLSSSCQAFLNRFTQEVVPNVNERILSTEIELSRRTLFA